MFTNELSTNLENFPRQLFLNLIFQMSLLGIRKIDPLRENDDYQLFTEANANAQSGTAAKTANMVG